jgi:hypothetical protein
MNTFRTAAGATLVGLLSAVAAAQGSPAAGGCDRACLTGIADAYLTALAAHAPSKAPLASNVKFTEQSRPLAVGDGLWKDVTDGPTAFEIVVPDPVSQQVGVLVMMKAKVPEPALSPSAGAAPAKASSGPVPIELALRLKVQNRRITEAEHLIAQITAPASLANLQTPRPAFTATLPPAERSPRDVMLLIANSYYDAITQNDGDLAPFAGDCDRRENGMHTAGVSGTRTSPLGGGGGAFGPLLGCREQIDTRALSYITSIDLRRVWIADPQKGLVFGLTMFRQPMREKFVDILNKDGTTTKRPMNFNPFDLEAAHIFKISGRKIHEIEAMGFVLPLDSKNGWSPFVR